MRLFFAVILSEELAVHVQESQARLRALAEDEGIRWTRPEQFHYTLKFLGEVPPLRAQKAAESALSLGETLAPFDLTLGGLGAFPNPQRPSTLWLGAQEGAERLVEMAFRLDDIMSRQDIKRESRRFNPHLTLARIKTYSGETAVARALRKLEESDRFAEVGTMQVDRFALMQSQLHPEGSQYTLVEEFRFNS